MSRAPASRQNPKPWPHCPCGRACYRRDSVYCSPECRRAHGSLGRPVKWPWHTAEAFRIPRRFAGSYIETNNNGLRQLARRYWPTVHVRKTRHGVTVMRRPLNLTGPQP
jgi:hypothetical protein